MATEKFIPISGLDNFTEEQKQTYYKQVCEHFGLPVELNLLEYIWMDGGDGARKLVLWAKKGATDIWRDKHDISVIKLIKDEGDGYVMFTAEGKNGKGRTEMAVGAADTKNRTGKALSDAVMTAQTRAIRRMTLQFVGGGFLDETEVSAQSVTAPMTSIPSAAVAVQPTVMPNPLVGKDITPKLETSPIREIAEASAAAVAASVTSTPKPRHRKRRNTVDFTMPGTESPNADIPESQHSVTQNPPTEGVSLQKIADLKPAKTSVQTSIENAQVVEGPDLKAAERPATEPDIQPAINAAILTKEEKQRFDEKMKHYRNVVLPIPTANNPQSHKTAGGMEPTDGIGGVAMKLRRYAEIMFNTQDLKILSVVQWEQFFKHLDDYLELHGAIKLVEQIDGAVVPK